MKLKTTPSKPYKTKQLDSNQRPIVRELKPLTHVLVAHHLLGGDGGLDPPDGALVDVHVQGQALEAAQEQHHRNGENTSQDHGDGDA